MNISKKRSCKNYKKQKTPNLCNKIIIYSIIILIIEIDLIRSNSYCQIDIKINGQGDQGLLFQYSIKNYDGKFINFGYSPNEIYINDILQNYTGKRVKNLTNEINNISMVFHTKLLYLTGMFANLNKITEIDFSKCDTSLVTNMEYAFYSCNSLVSLNLDKLNTSSVNSLNCAFLGCSSLKYLNLDYFDTSSVTNMISAFEGCNSLTSLNLSNFKTSKVNKMDGMFGNCKSLIYLNLNSFDTSKVNSMGSMFGNCTSLISLNLNNFDTSLVTDMSLMFIECNSLQSLYIDNFNTSKVKSFRAMFFNCFSLKTLHLKSFDTSAASEMKSFFWGCRSLTSLNLDNFDTSLVTDMIAMFRNCYSLEKLNINNFNTSLVENMGSMFQDCYLLKSLNLNNFNTSLVKSMNSMFWGCKALKSLNLKNFETSLVTNMYAMFAYCTGLEFLNIDNFYTPLLTNLLFMFYDCSSLISLNLNNFNTLSVDNMSSMFKGCSSLISLNLNNFDTSKVNKMEDMFKGCSSLIFLNINNFNTSLVNNMEGMFSECNPNLLVCINETIGSSLILKYQNTINIDCNNSCFENLDAKIIKEKDMCIDNCQNDSYYIYEYNNICYDLCPNGTYNSYMNHYFCAKNYTYYESFEIFDDLCKNNENSIKNKINNIQKELISGTFNILINSIKNNNDIIVNNNNIIFQITSAYNQKKNEYNNISSINIGECENILRKHYNLSDDMNLLIFKVEYFIPGFLIPIIEYEIYDDSNPKNKLNLTLCENVKININIPVSIDENNLFKYDPSSAFYNDICFPYTTEYKTDITLKDRRKEFIDKNMSLCENNCEYKGYDNNKKISKCECSIKTEFHFLSEIKIDKNLLLNNFIELEKISNIYVMKCYKLLFTKDGLKTNLGSYILLGIIFFIIIFTILFKVKGHKKIEVLVNEVIKNKNEEKSQISEDINKNITKIIDQKNKRNIHITNINDNLSHSENDLIKTYNKLKINQSFNIIDLNDYELNSLPYEEALKNDQRRHYQYYFSLLKMKHLIIFTFYTKTDYNSRLIKFTLFLFFFALYFTVNALFFTDSTMHKIYIDKGNIDMIYQIPQILYSTIISTIINYIVNYFSLTEKDIAKNKSSKDNNKTAYELIKCFKNKFIIFFTFCYLFIILFWYFLSCFCAVYINTQINLINDTIISFGLSLLYPFPLYIIPCIFRTLSLKYNKKCLYKINNIIFN